MSQIPHSISHGKDPIDMLEGGSNLASVMIFQDWHVDDFQVLPVLTPVPDAFPQFNPMPSRSSEAGVGNIFIRPVTIGSVITRSNELISDRVQKVSGYSKIFEQIIHQV
jgi:hypothetical protein